MKPFLLDNGNTLRPATEQDEALAQEWTAADPAHAGKIPASFWTEKENPSADCYVLEDKDGTVMFVRLERVTRILIQFPPRRAVPLRRRAAVAMKTGINWLAAALGVNRQCDLIFDTESDALKSFAESSLGFSEYIGILRRRIPVYTPRKSTTS